MVEPLVLTHPSPTPLEADYWPTPAWVTHALVDHYPPPSDALIVEPAAGDGAILRVLLDRGYRRFQAIELREAEQQHLLMTGADVLIGDWIAVAGDYELQLHLFAANQIAVVTNPPFGLAREYVRTCLALDPVYCALLLPPSAICGTQEWRPVWSEVARQTGELRLTRRPSFGKGNGMAGVLWLIWERGKPPLAVRYV